MEELFNNVQVEEKIVESKKTNFRHVQFLKYIS
jgi:hypothetical protein